MKAENTFVGAVAVLIALAVSGCAALPATGTSYGGDRAPGGGALATTPTFALPHTLTPLAEWHHHPGTRSSHVAVHTARR